MRAAVVREWGRPADVVHIEQVGEPVVGPDAVLVQVACASVNPVDWKIVAGGLQGAYPHHRPLIPGWDVAGTVLATGPAVTSVAPGDRVAAYARKDHVQNGTFAERVAVPDRAVAPVPHGVPDDVAAALPLAGLTAMQAIDAVEVAPPDTVLVLNATGGVGGIAVQLAQLRGARVLGSASPARLEGLAARGVEPVDYADLEPGVRAVAPDGVDVVVDLIGGESLTVAATLLRPGGRLVSITDAAAVQHLARRGVRARYVFVRPDAPMLGALLALVANGLLTVDIAARFPLEQAAEALEQSRAGHTAGKIVITVAAGQD